MNEFGIFLSSLRKRAGMTQQDLADKLGVTNKAISKWETGEAFPDTALLVPISDIFGVSVDDLLRGREGAVDGDKTQKTENDPVKERDHIVQKYVPKRWHKKFALLICLGIELIFVGVLTVIVVGLLTEDETYQLFSACAMLTLIAASVAIFITAGILNGNAFLPVPDPTWRQNVNRFAAFMASGVFSIIIGTVCFALSSLLEGSPFFALGIAVAFLFLFGGISLLIYGGISWSGYSGHIKAELKHKKSSEAEDALAALTAEERRQHTLGAKIGSIIMLFAVIIFLIVGFVWDLWHPGWIVFPIAGILCGIANVIWGKK